MNKFKAIFTDVDGTLLNSDKLVDENTLKSISKLKDANIKFGISTGRPYNNILMLLDKWKLTNYVDYVIGYNGADVYDINNNKLYSNYYLDELKVKEIYNITKDLDCATIIYDDQLLVSNIEHEFMETHSKKLGYKHICTDLNEYVNKSYAKMLLMSDIGNQEELIKELKGIDGISIFSSSSYLLEVVDNRVNKSFGISIIKNELGLTNEEIVTFGDEANDYEMIRDYYGVAMGNAINKIKDVSKYITDSNDESGVSNFINKYIL